MRESEERMSGRWMEEGSKEIESRTRAGAAVAAAAAAAPPSSSLL